MQGGDRPQYRVWMYVGGYAELQEGGRPQYRGYVQQVQEVRPNALLQPTLFGTLALPHHAQYLEYLECSTIELFNYLGRRGRCWPSVRTNTQY